MEFLADYASFLAKSVTVVLAIVAVLLALAILRARGRGPSTGHLQVLKLNEFYQGLRDRLEQSLLDKDQLKAHRKAKAKAEKTEKASKKAGDPKPRVYVLDFDGDIRASAVEHLRHEVTALLSLATAQDEVVVRLESGGGHGPQLRFGILATGADSPGWGAINDLRGQGSRQRRLHDGVHW